MARQQTAKLRKSIQTAEQELEKLGRRKEELEKKLADPELYEGHSHDLQVLNTKLAAVDKSIAAAEKTWLKAEEQLATTNG